MDPPTHNIRPSSYLPEVKKKITTTATESFGSSASSAAAAASSRNADNNKLLEKKVVWMLRVAIVLFLCCIGLLIEILLINSNNVVDGGTTQKQYISSSSSSSAVVVDDVVDRLVEEPKKAGQVVETKATEKTIAISVINKEDEDVGDDVASKKRLQQISPVCRPNFGPSPHNIKRIFFGHMRKAGGTTLRKYIKRVAEEHGLEFVVREGDEFEIPGTRNDTIYITHMRDPISRTISHYKYDQRWDCRQMIGNKTYVPTYENEIVDFDTHIRRGNCYKKFPNLHWHCVYNCHIRWLANPMDHCDPFVHGTTKDKNRLILAPIDTLYIEARKRALNYNLIVDTGLLSNKDYTDNIERMLSLGNFTGSFQAPYCATQSYAANKAYPAIILNETMEELRKLSQPDYKLYNEMVGCPNGIQFPSQTLGQLLSSSRRKAV